MVKSPSHDVVGGISVFGGTDHSPSASSRVVFGQDRRSGLKAIISIDSTVLGPALGGTRFYPYEWRPAEWCTGPGERVAVKAATVIG